MHQHTFQTTEEPEKNKKAVGGRSATQEHAPYDSSFPLTKRPTCVLEGT